jgi:hypothetical protein
VCRRRAAGARRSLAARSCLVCRAASGAAIRAAGTQSAADLLLRRIYELYCDYVLKNPFYEIEQVIKCELFDINVEAMLRRYPTMT